MAELKERGWSPSSPAFPINNNTTKDEVQLDMSGAATGDEGYRNGQPYGTTTATDTAVGWGPAGTGGPRASTATRAGRAKGCTCNRHGCGPILASGLAYFGAALMFLFSVNFASLPKAPFPVIGNALPQTYWLVSDEAILIPMIAWGVHYLRRFGEVLFVHDYRRSMPCGESIGASVYYWGFGFWIGYSVNFKLGYLTPTWPFLAPGLILFVVGEVGNCAVHLAQRQLRRRPGSESVMSPSGNQHVIPTGFLFKYVSCPNYTFEIITWIGFGLIAFTLPAALFLIASITTLVIYAHKKHKGYKAEFDGEDGRPLYPPKRKALIPFIF